MRTSWLGTGAAAILAVGLGAGAASAAGADDPFAIRFDLGLWSIIVFLGLYFLLRKFAWGPILKGLQEREESIRKAAEEAKLARAETERARANFQRQLDEAHAEIPRMMGEGRRAAQALAEEMRTRAAQEIQADRQRLRREIETARDQALQEIWSQAAQLATLISAKAIRRALSADDHKRLVDEALDELKQAAHKRQ
jgi:F-type H+-transporting ATPase subunit b